MAETETSERRYRDRHVLPVVGAVLYHAAAMRGTAMAINVSLGGILLESGTPWPAVGTEVELTFSIEDYGLMFSVPGKLVRVEGKRAAVQFQEESAQLKRVIEKALGVW